MHILYYMGGPGFTPLLPALRGETSIAVKQDFRFLSPFLLSSSLFIYSVLIKKKGGRMTSRSNGLIMQALSSSDNPNGNKKVYIYNHIYMITGVLSNYGNYMIVHTEMLLPLSSAAKLIRYS